VELPRQPEDINIVKVVRKGMNKHQDVFERMFKVQKQRVLVALKWLIRFNTLYRDYSVEIKEDNLSWMGD
jgi:hypothetical protein